MFQRDLQYFPTMREIRDELIEAQINQISIKAQDWENINRIDKLVEIYTDKWEWLFKIGNLGTITKPLTSSILSNP